MFKNGCASIIDSIFEKLGYREEFNIYLYTMINNC